MNQAGSLVSLARNHTATHLLDAALKEVLGDHVNQAGSLVSPEALRFDFTHFEAMTSEQIRAVDDLVNEQILAAKTHLLDAALKEVLGDHVNQAGSLVSPEALRFDFTHFEAMTSEQIRAVEDLVNEQILAAKPVVTRVMGIEEAKASGAVALFGEKYGDTVRVVSIGAEDEPFSRELCGGTHAANTAELGLFKIVSESSTGSKTSRSPASCAVAPTRPTPPSSVCSRSSPSLPPAPMSVASRL